MKNLLLLLAALPIGACCSAPLVPDAGRPLSTEPLGQLRLDPYEAGLVTVTADLAGAERRLLFDTGGGMTIVTPALARELACEPTGRITGFRMKGERVDAPTCAPTPGTVLRIGGLAFEVDRLAILDLGKMLLPEWPPVDGLVSLHTLRGHAFTLDLEAGRLTLESPGSLAARTATMGRLTARLGGQAGGEAVDLFLAVAGPHTDFWFIADTGNTGPVLIAEHAAEALRAADPTGPLFVPGLGETHPPRATLPLVLDGNLGAAFLRGVVLTADLRTGAAWGLRRGAAPHTARGVEGFWPVDQIDTRLLHTRGVPLDPATVHAVAPRVGKLVIAHGTQQAPSAQLERLEARLCADPAVAVWNQARCAGLDGRRCDAGQCSYEAFGNCSGFLLEEGTFLTAAHCVAALHAEPGLAAASTILFPGPDGDPLPGIAVGPIQLGKTDFSHHWIALHEKDPVDVALVRLEPRPSADPAERWPTAGLPDPGAPLFLVGYPRVAGRTASARRAAGYDLVRGTPTASFGRLADANPDDRPLCAVDMHQEHWQLADPCPDEPLAAPWGTTWKGPITRSPFLATYDSANGYSGAPVFDAEGRLVGINATLASAFNPQRRFDDTTRQVATPIGRALDKLDAVAEAEARARAEQEEKTP